MRFYFIFLFLISALNFSCRTTPAISKNHSPKFSQLEDSLQIILDGIVKENGLPGMTMAVVFDESRIINLASGYADLEKKIAMKPTSRMMSGSVGKTFVSAVALQLLEQGKFKLEDKLAQYLGNKSWYKQLPNGEDITIADLLNHTSGMLEYLAQQEFMIDFRADFLKERNPEECIAYVLGKPALHAAGKGWAYSDTNYLLLGLVLEKITGVTYYQLQNDQLISPLHLSLTEPSNGRIFTGMTQGYVGNENFFKLPNKMLTNGEIILDPSFEWTGGGLVTNVKDLARWMKLLHGGKVLKKETYERMIKPKSTSDGQLSEYGYGLGTFIWDRPDGIRYAHSGFFPGYLTQAEYSKNRAYSIAIQINTDEGAQKLTQYISQLEVAIDNYLK